jgi:hypothetical protein
MRTVLFYVDGKSPRYMGWRKLSAASVFEARGWLRDGAGRHFVKIANVEVHSVSGIESALKEAGAGL